MIFGRTKYWRQAAKEYATITITATFGFGLTIPFIWRLLHVTPQPPNSPNETKPLLTAEVGCCTGPVFLAPSNRQRPGTEVVNVWITTAKSYRRCKMFVLIKMFKMILTIFVKLDAAEIKQTDQKSPYFTRPLHVINNNLLIHWEKWKETLPNKLLKAPVRNINLLTSVPDSEKVEPCSV